ncbi:MAG: OmpA family protein [Desulfobacterales bacterium]|nr:OmpA family protein [Desulfobacterales bacterium]
MKTKITAISFVLTLLFCAGNILATDVPSVEDFTNALMPKQSAEPQEKTRSFTPGGKKRGIASIRRENQEPSVTMLLQFKKDSDELMPEAVATLQNLGKALQGEKLKYFAYRIEGYTCDLGSNAYNLALSRRRAASVQNFLVNTFDLPPRQFDVEGFGEKNPSVPNTDEIARRKNRRVVIKNTLDSFTPNSTEHPKVTAQVKYFRNNQVNILQRGDILTQNDNYAIEFKPKNNAHVYIYQVDTTGAMTLVFPNPDFSRASNPVQAGTHYRVPDQGNWFYLDNNTGKEQIIVMAHKKPLAESEKICRKILTPQRNSIMMASADRRELTREYDVKKEGKTRGLQSIRKELPYNNTPAPEPSGTYETPEPSQVNMSDLFVWKQHFLHQ